MAITAESKAKHTGRLDAAQTDSSGCVLMELELDSWPPPPTSRF
jgi:hypothetical protein